MSQNRNFKIWYSAYCYIDMSCTSEQAVQDMGGCIEDVYWDLDSLITVKNVSIDTSVVDGTCLEVELRTRMVEPDVEEVISSYGAIMKRPRINKDSNLCVEIIPSENQNTEEFKDSGQNTMRKRGGSRMIAIPPEAIERAGFSEDETIMISSRSDEILLSSD